MFKGYFGTISNRVGQSGRQFRAGGWIFTPGVLLILVGLGFIVAPRLLLALGAVLFISFGALFCFLAYKLVRLKAKLDKFARNIETRIVIQPDETQDSFVTEDSIAEESKTEITKKIVYH